MTPSRNGRMTRTWPGVRPTICLASWPTARIRVRPSVSVMAMTEGSLSTTPRPFRNTRMLAVPRSIAMSLENAPNSFGIISFPKGTSDVLSVIAVSKYHANHHRSPTASDADDGVSEALVCATEADSSSGCRRVLLRRGALMPSRTRGKVEILCLEKGASIEAECPLLITSGPTRPRLRESCVDGSRVARTI